MADINYKMPGKDREKINEKLMEMSNSFKS
jgi:hypothetical protein